MLPVEIWLATLFRYKTAGIADVEVEDEMPRRRSR
jgi:hypothetical protein